MIRAALTSLSLVTLLMSIAPAQAVTEAQRARARKNVKVLDAWEAQMAKRLRELERSAAGSASTGARKIKALPD